MTQIIKTTLIEGVGWPEVGKIPPRFRHDYVKRICTFPSTRKKPVRNGSSKDLDDKFDEWLNKGAS